jgi:hypothetical protein
MKKIIKLTESDLTRIVKKIVKENESSFSDEQRISGDFEHEMGKLLRNFEDRGMSLEQIHKQFKTWDQYLYAKIHRKKNK